LNSKRIRSTNIGDNRQKRLAHIKEVVTPMHADRQEIVCIKKQ